MQVFNKIKVICNNSDIDIVDDDSDTELSGKCSVDNGCLVVDLRDDTVLSVPPGQYDEIVVYSINGDCTIKLLNSTVNQIYFDSNCGDLTVEADCNNVTFKSDCGDYIKKKIHKNQTVGQKRSLVVKELKDIETTKERRASDL